MKYRIMPAALAVALFCTACSTLEGSRRLVTRAGLAQVEAGRLDSDRMPSASIELETSGPGEPASGVLAFDWTGGPSDSVDLPQGETDVDVEQVGVRAGLRIRPEEWDLRLRPFLGAGIGWTRVQAEGAGRKEGGEDVGPWLELGVELGALSLAWRIEKPDVDLGEGLGDLRSEALTIGYGFSF